MVPPSIRMIYFGNLSSQRWKELINYEISTLTKATHPNICNIIDCEGSDGYAIRLSLEPMIGTPLSDILLRSSPTNDQISYLLSNVSRINSV
jgi:hypothetical protein